MDWGDTPAWVACALSAGALIISLKARGDGKESARAAVRSADAAEATLAEQRREAEERRAAEAEAARPRPALAVEYSRGSAYRLCNYGTGPALKVTVLEEGLPPVVRNRPIEVDLQPDEAHEFLMTGTMGGPVPPQIYVTWDGQDTPVPLRVPG